MRICEKRILICDEYKIEGGFSYQHIKRWMSNAPISLSDRTEFLSQTLIVISNKILLNKRAAFNNSIGRRLVIYDIRKKLGKEKLLPQVAIDNSVMLKFISLCVAYGNSFKSTPTSLAIAMYTVSTRSIIKTTAGIGYDVTSSKEECTVDTSAMAIRCRVTPRKLCQALRAFFLCDYGPLCGQMLQR